MALRSRVASVMLAEIWGEYAGKNRHDRHGYSARWEHRPLACMPRGHVVRSLEIQGVGCCGYNGLQSRGAHRLQVYVPTEAATDLALLQSFRDAPYREMLRNVPLPTHTPRARLRPCLVCAARVPRQDERGQ